MFVLGVHLLLFFPTNSNAFISVYKIENYFYAFGWFGSYLKITDIYCLWK